MAYYHKDIYSGICCLVEEYENRKIEYINVRILTQSLIERINLLKSFLQQEEEIYKKNQNIYDNLTLEKAKEHFEYYNTISQGCSEVIVFIKKQLSLYYNATNKIFQLDINQIALLTDYLFKNEFAALSILNKSEILSNITGYGKDNIRKAIKSFNSLRKGKRKHTLKDINNHKIIFDLFNMRQLKDIQDLIKEDINDLEKE